MFAYGKLRMSSLIGLCNGDMGSWGEKDNHKDKDGDGDVDNSAFQRRI